MKSSVYIFFLATIALTSFNLNGQNSDNCFFDDFELKTAEIPPSVDAEKPLEPASVIVTLQNDTLGKVSKYIFGNAIAAWAGAHDNPKLVEGVKRLAPTLIRFPGGSWSNGYFWNGLPFDLPDSIYDGTTYNQSTKTAKKIKFWGQTGKGGWQTTPDQYYALRKKTGVAEGLITINYGYARYGLSDDPVATAAHLAADWVRYDNGRTKFWEIGNENSGPWEYGWMIDTTLNKDGQPQIITGELYGKHFKVFADSMRKAAAEIGAKIYIGGQVVHFDPASAWNFVDKTWNEGFFREVGDAADFYVMHNYFSGSNVTSLLNIAVTEPKKNMDFIKRDIAAKGAYPKPVALTEYNISFGDAAQKVISSYINGMQAVILFNELIKNNFGMSCRWLLVTGEGGMFYDGSNTKCKYHPIPEFYYVLYTQKFTGDHSISASSSNRDILCYATRFSSGETSVIIVNKNTKEQVVTIDANAIGVGNSYYIYSFTGGTESEPFSQYVYINGYGPDEYHWGPYNNVLSIPAYKYPIEKEIKFTSPGRSVQMIMIEGGNNYVSVKNEEKFERIHSFKLFQNYPNPFNPSTLIEYEIPVDDFVTLRIYDVLGNEIMTLVNEPRKAGRHSVLFNAIDLPSGLYIYSLAAGTYHDAKKFLLLK